jgi:alpha-N-arabinofuranosidase
VDRVIGEATVPGGDGEPLVLTVSARGQEYALLAGAPDRAPTTVAVADGRTLDTVATGGFLGLWIGVHGTSNGAPTSTVAHVERVEYLLPEDGSSSTPAPPGSAPVPGAEPDHTVERHA